jgi:hypothetical protein
MIEIRRGLDEIFWIACALEEGKSASCTEFDVVLGGRHAVFSLYFRY